MEGCAAANESKHVVVISSPSLEQTLQSNVLDLMPSPTENCWRIWCTNLKQVEQCSGTRWRGAPHPLYEHQLGRVSCMPSTTWAWCVCSIIWTAWLARMSNRFWSFIDLASELAETLKSKLVGMDELRMTWNGMAGAGETYLCSHLCEPWPWMALILLLILLCVIFMKGATFAAPSTRSFTKPRWQLPPFEAAWAMTFSA